MANKREFLDALDAHIQSLQAGLDQITETVAANGKRVSALKSERQKRLDYHVENLLPNLELSTFVALSRKLRGFPTMEQAQAMIVDERRTYQDQIDRLLAQFDPQKYEGLKIGLEVELQKAEEDLGHVKASFEEFAAIPEVKRLIRTGYGTSKYSHGILDREYYQDWKAADSIMAQARTRSWSEFLNQYQVRSSNMEPVKDRIASLQKRLTDLNACYNSYEDLKVLLAKAPESVLEKLRVKVKAQLDMLDPAPDWMSDIVSIGQQMVSLQQENAKYQETRGKISDQMADLQKIRLQATRSKQNTVPDEYVRKLQRANRSMDSGGSSGGRSVVHVYHDDSSFLSAMVYANMLHHFDSHSHSHGGHSHSGIHERDHDFAAARADRSGNS